MVLGQKMCGTLKINLFICYNFYSKYIFFSFNHENNIFGYFHHHIRDQRLKIRGYSEF